LGHDAGKHGCLVSVFLLPWMMLKLIFFQMPKAFLALPRALARSVSSQSTTASGGAALPAGLGALVAAQRAGERDAAIAAIGVHDPAFVAADVVRWARGVHDVIAASVVQGDAGPARLVMADALWGSHRMLLSIRSDHGVTRGGTVRVVGAALVEAFHSRLIDEVRVRLSCHGVCYDSHSGTGLDLRGSRRAAGWHEDFTFTRSARAVTPAGGGVLASCCPNCGAPIAVSGDGACTTCFALVMSGRQDWVLTGLGRDPW
jgi:hypothetical protein